MENLRAFEIKYIPPTNSRGSRIKIEDLRHEKKIIISFNYEDSNIKDTAFKLLESKGIKILYACESQKGYILLTKNFDIQIK